MHRWFVAATTVACIALVAGCAVADGKRVDTPNVPGTITPSPSITVNGVIHLTSVHGVACFTLASVGETWGILTPPGASADAGGHYLGGYGPGPGSGLTEGVVIGLKGENADTDADWRAWKPCAPVDRLLAFSGQTE